MTTETSENLRNVKEVRFRVREFGGDPRRPLYLLNPNFKCFFHQDADIWKSNSQMVPTNIIVVGF